MKENPEWKVGDELIRKKIFTAQDVQLFAELTGDFNPVHFDPVFAASTIFKKPIVHGPLVLTFVTTLFANELPGPGTVYLAHELKFMKPVYIGNEISAYLRITEITEKGHLFVETNCLNEQGELVITGVARLKQM